MKLKLTLERGHGREPVDVLVAVEPATTVGELADRLARSEPDGSFDRTARYTLVLPDEHRAELPSGTQLLDSGVHSGATVALAPTGGRFGTGSAATPAAAVVVVVSGPDQGREFPVPPGTSTMGRDRSCDVRLSDPMVSRQHARIHVGETVELVDMGSANGLLVGEDQTDRAVVHPGDVVGIGDSWIAVRHLAAGGGRREESSAVPFNRPPRIDTPFVGASLVAPEPPDPPTARRLPVLPLFAPLIMGVVIYLSTHAVASLLFVAMSPLLIVANAVEGRMAGSKAYGAAVGQFRDDVADLADEAGRLARDEVQARLAEVPSVDECAGAISTLSGLLWSRWPDLRGFGALRLGLGRQPSRSRVELLAGRRNNRGLWRELEEAVAPFSTVDGVPVVAALQDVGAIGVGGPRPSALGAARALVLQACALHSPADLVLTGLASSQTGLDWEWIKWFPHCSSAQSPLRGTPGASSETACAALLDELDRLIAEREAGDGGGRPALPVVLVVVEDDAPVVRSRVTSIAQRGAPVGIHLLWVAADVSRLPAACRTFLEVRGEPGEGAAGFVHADQRVEPLAVDWVSEAAALAAARRLSPVFDAAAADPSLSDLPQNVSLLSLSGTDVAVIPEAVVERWVESRSIQSGPRAAAAQAGLARPGTLRATIGENATGPHVLDLRAHGPHALVGGTTGSGKSELLQTWILGMALTNSPERVTFLLVDYKGGSAFSECRYLPHTVGLVTDLSPHLVRRALTSLRAELRHREALLHRKKAKDLVSLERVRDPETPPSLVIVVDEFAALVQEVPEFVDGVVDVAQRGRSLGLHLILATQRPAGVIKDNLRANTNLRLALRVADEADSIDVLGATDAAAFDAATPGRAMSRTGPSQLVPFQSAYAGGWTSDTPPPPAIDVATFGFAPRVVWEEAIEAAVTDEDPGPTDIQRLVANVTAAHALAELPGPRLPWLAELAKVYDLALLPSGRRDREIVFGVADDPENQRQPIVAFRPDEDGNLAVYGTGNSGKSTLLRTLAIASGYTVRGGPCQVYGLDFGSRGLQMLEALPHVGSIVAGSDTERVGRLLGMLRQTIDERAARYAGVGAGTITSYREVTGHCQEPRILLLVDGMGAFRTAYEGSEHIRLFESFVSIAADGRPVGVHVVLSADRASALPVALASQVQRRIVLRLADANDYSAFGLPNDVLDQSSPPGRGLLDDLEVQVAVFGKSPDMATQAREVERLAESMRTAGVAPAAPIERLRDEIFLDELPAMVEGRPVIGVSGATLGPVPVDPSGTFTVAGGPGSGRTTAVTTVLAAVQRWRGDARLFYVGNRRSPLLATFKWERSAVQPDDVVALAGDLPGLVGDASPETAPCVVLIEGINDFLNTPADSALQAMVKGVTSQGHLLVTDGEPSGLSGSFPLLVAARSSRSGIVLQPEQSDGALFKAQFPPRLRRVDYPIGRGLYVSRGGLPLVVQVAMPPSGSAPH